MHLKGLIDDHSSLKDNPSKCCVSSGSFLADKMRPVSGEKELNTLGVLKHAVHLSRRNQFAIKLLDMGCMISNAKVRSIGILCTEIANQTSVKQMPVQNENRLQHQPIAMQK